jgi:hypothetical protein
MNNFIEALKEEGIYDRIVKTIVNVRKRNDVKDVAKGITNILKLEMNRNHKLFDIYVHDIEDLAFEIVITEIMKSVADVEKNDVNLDEMLKESTEKEEALEDAVIDSFIDFLNEITNIFND